MRIVSTLGALLPVTLLVVGCASRAPQAVPPPPSVALPDLPGLTVVLAWDAAVDLDLYVTDPTWETVYFANNPSRSGGRLRNDVRCADVAENRGSFREIVHFAAPATGGYRVGVDLIDACDSGIELAGFRIATSLAGRPHEEKTGMIRLGEFQSLAHEYRLGESDLAP
jgi:hypothetical protein